MNRGFAAVVAVYAFAVFAVLATSLPGGLLLVGFVAGAVVPGWRTVLLALVVPLVAVLPGVRGDYEGDAGAPFFSDLLFIAPQVAAATAIGIGVGVLVRRIFRRSPS